jgi:hypothetical protein
MLVLPLLRCQGNMCCMLVVQHAISSCPPALTTHTFVSELVKWKITRC